MCLLRSVPSGAFVIVATVIVGGLFTFGTMMVSAAQCSLVSRFVLQGPFDNEAVSYVVNHSGLTTVGFCENAAAGLWGSFRRGGNSEEPLSTPDKNASTERIHLFGFYPGRKYDWFCLPSTVW